MPEPQPLARLLATWARHGRPRRATALLGLSLAAAFAGGAPPDAPSPDRAGDTVRFGFSSAMFQGINTNDAQAAMKVWSGVMAAERQIPISPVTVIFDGVPALVEALRQRRIEAVTVTAEEYWTLRQEVPLGEIILGAAHGETTENYVVLIKASSPARDLADLKGLALNRLRTSRADFASVWLETELLEQGLGRSASFFGRITQDSKLSRIVLPVFFGQADACLVTRSGYRVMCELNPQLAKQLRVLAESPAYVPVVFVFRADWDSPYHTMLLEVLGDVDLAPAGQQTLALFQQDDLVVRPASDLDATCELIDRHHRLLGAGPEASPVPDPTAVPSGIAPSAP